MSEESTTLIIRHLPSVLSKDEKEDLLRHFGAVHVRCMPDSGRMRHTAFATYETSADAKYSLSRLHQLEILGCRLVVEFAKPQEEKHFPHESDFKKQDTHTQDNEKQLTEKEEIQEKMEALYTKLHAIAPNFGLEYLASPLLKYKYPPPTHLIITNISHALAAVPKFYTQVLHLMNKMNLPAPFGPLTAAPPLYSDNTIFGEQYVSCSEEESEIESDQDERREALKPTKRPTTAKKRPRKKPKLQQLAMATVPVTHYENRATTAPQDVFEIPDAEIGAKKILFNIKPHAEDHNEKLLESVEETGVLQQPPVTVEEGGFGIIIPQKVDSNETESQNQDADALLEATEFISLSEIRSNRMSSREIRHASVFKNYQEGQKTYRLYVKNLSKQVQEKDLVRIYGRYIDRKSDSERNMFDVRLMKEGRMKGQAFVTLANETQAEEALRDTNGYFLHGKPIVVQYARSARPKETKS